LVLLKSATPENSQLDLRMMTESGLVDKAFSDFVLNKTFGRWVLNKGDFEHFTEGVNASMLNKVGGSIH
jgi:5-(aminomethyl)-3-furanmethanol phosphate kinase